MGTVTKTPAVNGSADCQSYQRRSRGISGRLHKQSYQNPKSCCVALGVVK